MKLAYTRLLGFRMYDMEIFSPHIEKAGDGSGLGTPIMPVLQLCRDAAVLAKAEMDGCRSSYPCGLDPNRLSNADLQSEL